MKTVPLSISARPAANQTSAAVRSRAFEETCNNPDSFNAAFLNCKCHSLHIKVLNAFECIFQSLAFCKIAGELQ